MLSLTSPAWLFALAIVPLLWWLHRWRAGGPVIVVSALFLWQTTGTDQATGDRLEQADPAWRRRALLSACIVMALAGPFRQTADTPIHVWVDDSLSMYTIENGGTRLQAGLDQVRAALAEGEQTQVTFHSLTDPSRQWTASGELPTGFTTPGDTLRPPPPILMMADAEHWLISDGAAPAVAAWLAGAPITRVFQTGRLQNNAALTTLAVRPALTAAGDSIGLVTAVNHGAAPVDAELTVTAGGRMLHRQPVPLPAAATIHPTFRIGAGITGEIQAALRPGDALALDDILQLTLPAPAGIQIAGACGPHLRAALATHPRLQLDAATPALTIACDQAATGGPVLRVTGMGATLPVTEPPFWQPAAGTLQSLALEPAWLQRFAAAPAIPDTQPLLTAGDVPLIVIGSEPAPWIDVRIDLEAEALVRRPEYPLLVAGLLDRLAGRSLLEAIAEVHRDPEASRIAPHPLVASRDRPALPATGRIDLGPWLLVLAGWLLLLDFARLYRSVPESAA